MGSHVTDCNTKTAFPCVFTANWANSQKRRIMLYLCGSPNLKFRPQTFRARAKSPLACAASVNTGLSNPVY